MNKRLPLLPLALLLLVVLGLAACGGGDSTGSGEEGQIETVIEESVTSSDPAKCTELMTQNFVEQTAGAEGEEALEECEEEAGDESDDADSVEVTEVEVDGTEATAHAAFVGGGLDGQTVIVALVKAGGRWKLDEIEGFAELDRDSLIAALEEQLEASGELSDEQTACIVDGLKEASDKAFEGLLLKGESAELAEIAAGCE